MEANRNFGVIFRDRLDDFLGAAITDRFGEESREQDEGPAEFANPNTVSQPVQRSQNAGGDTLSRLERLALTPQLLTIVGLVISIIILLITRR